MSEKSNLKPCPFCNSQDIRSMLHNNLGGPFVGKPYWGVDCLDCDAQVQRVFLSDLEIYGTGETAQEMCERMWNMRSGVFETDVGNFTPTAVFGNILRLWDIGQIREFYEMLSRIPDFNPKEDENEIPS